MLPPNPCLLAILLITKARGGPRQIFQYPPKPGKRNLRSRLDHQQTSEEDSGSSDEDEDEVDSSSDDGEIDYNGDNSSPEEDGEKYAEPDVDESGSISPEKSDSHMWHPSQNGKTGYLGLSVNLPHLLCPPATAHKKKFEISIDGLTFLGWPVFAKEDGGWRRPKKKKMKRGSFGGSREGKGKEIHTDEEPSETSGRETTEDEQKSPLGLQSDTASTATGAESEEAQHQESLNMFHVVFVMDPPPLEHQQRVSDMYKHVVKKFSRALKWEQARVDYVLKETVKLRELDLEGESSVQRKMKQSSLAKAIATLYTSISTSSIAQLTLTAELSISLQIPIPTSISTLPRPTSPQLPGIWLTTATSLPTDDEFHENRPQLASHFTLLLLADLPSILNDINATDSPLIGPLTNYLRASTPRKSFLQISQCSGISLSDIQLLASHLIYWRKARAIPPLHHKDTYIVSPNADMRKLRSASSTYARLFPALPTLPKILSLLSSTPRPFSTFIPSKDHKQTYLEILAWLMRGGWVTQLRTFAWVRVSAEIQTMVAKEIRKEGKQNSPAQGDSSDAEAESSSAISKASSEAGDADFPSGYLSPPRSTHSATSSTSASSNRTAIPIPLNLPSGAHTHSAPQTFASVFILNPARPSSIESRWLSAISNEMLAMHGAEVRDAWEKCLKYINGQHALEKIAVREGWKRRKVTEFLAAWRGMGVLMEVRHW